MLPLAKLSVNRNLQPRVQVRLLGAVDSPRLAAPSRKVRYAAGRSDEPWRARQSHFERTHFSSCVPEQRPHSLGPWRLAGAQSFGTFEGSLDRQVVSREEAWALLAVGHETPRPLDAGDAD